MIFNHTLLTAYQHNGADMVPNYGYEWQRAMLFDTKQAISAEQKIEAGIEE